MTESGSPARWRVGRRVGRTIYRMAGAGPSDDDRLIGVMDTRELAAVVVRAVNHALADCDGPGRHRPEHMTREGQQ